ncbi:MAG: lipopolysaccharide assembly protein LapB [Pseudomonadota bacterium]
MLEFLLLLLPVAAATGWLAGRKGGIFGVTQNTLTRPAPEYFHGLNYLLNEQPDKAIEVFIRMVEVDSETMETHLALGNLFRQRGEVDRAIRIHQNLVSRPNLSAQLRGNSMLELARDYMAAGLFDRSESIFAELLSLDSHTSEACASLIVIYEREREWQKAIDTAKHLHNKTGEARNEVVAHYYCEIASDLLQEEQFAEAKAHLNNALTFDKHCARADIMHADIALQQKDFGQADGHFKRAYDKDDSLMPVIIVRWLSAVERQSDNTRLREFIAGIRKGDHDFEIVSAIADMVERVDGKDAAEQMIKDELVENPTLKGLHKWAEIELDKSKDSERDKIRVVVDMLGRVIETKPSFTCNLCGFRGHEIHWQCPGCKSWDTVKPLKSDDVV